MTTSKPTPTRPAAALARLLDANANRAAEGLRTLEDLARFVLDRGDLSGQAKALRHRVRTIAAQLLEPTGLDARDTPHDVGTGLTESTERSRQDLAEVADAAASRTTESLRVLEETAKVLDPASGADFEAARYATYELHRVVGTALRARAPQWKACLLLTTELCAGRDPLEVLQAAIVGGVDCVQVREKTMESGPLLAHTQRVVHLAHAAGIHAIVNDRADLAKLTGADGVHVGQSDLSVAQVRAVAGPSAIVGVSTANLQQARQAAADGASYCGCGPMFPSTTKAKPTLSGPNYLRAYLGDAQAAARPHLAISGINTENIKALAALGCRGVAVSSVICGASDPGGMTQQLVRALETVGAGE